MKIKITIDPTTNEFDAPFVFLDELQAILQEMTMAEKNRQLNNISGEYCDVKIQVTK